MLRMAAGVSDIFRIRIFFFSYVLVINGKVVELSLVIDTC